MRVLLFYLYRISVLGNKFYADCLYRALRCLRIVALLDYLEQAGLLLDRAGHHTAVRRHVLPGLESDFLLPAGRLPWNQMGFEEDAEKTNGTRVFL